MARRTIARASRILSAQGCSRDALADSGLSATNETEDKYANEK